MSYTTKSGDMWDSISYQVYGTVDYTGRLMAANSDYLEDNYIFPAGIVLQVPEVEDTEDLQDVLPPWRK